MSVTIKEDLDKIIIVGDRVLIKPKSPQEKTRSGLFLPPGVEQKEKLHSGYIVKVGPGFPIPSMNDYDEAWKTKKDLVKYIPLQAEVGDLAVYMQSMTHEIKFKDEAYMIVPYQAILMLVRDEGLLK